MLCFTCVDLLSAESQEFWNFGKGGALSFYSKIHEKVGTPVKFCTSRQINTAETLRSYCRNVVNIKLGFGFLLSIPVSKETFNIAPMEKFDMGLNLF